VATHRAALAGAHRIQAGPVAEITSQLTPCGSFDLLSIDIESLDAEIVRFTDRGS